MKILTLVIMREDEITDAKYDEATETTIFHMKPSRRELVRKVVNLPDDFKGSPVDIMHDYFQAVTNRLYDDNRRRCKIFDHSQTHN